MQVQSWFKILGDQHFEFVAALFFIFFTSTCCRTQFTEFLNFIGKHMYDMHGMSKPNLINNFSVPKNAGTRNFLKKSQFPSASCSLVMNIVGTLKIVTGQLDKITSYVLASS